MSPKKTRTLNLADKVSTRGFTLVECIMALAVVGIGAVATAKMVTMMYKSTSDTHAVAEAVALATRVIAEVNDASMVPGLEDPGLISSGQAISNVASPAEIQAPIPNSRIQSIGKFATGSLVPGIGTPTLLVTYEVRNCTVCGIPYPSNPGLTSINGVDVMVSVYNVPPFTRLTRPLHFLVRKNYQPSMQDLKPANLRF